MPFTRSENWRVIDSGVAIPMTGKNATIEVDGLGAIEFVFERTGETRIDIAPVDGGATVTISGISSSTIGAGTKEVIKFGNIGGKAVNLNLRWQGLSEGNPFLIYAFYIEP